MSKLKKISVRPLKVLRERVFRIKKLSEDKLYNTDYLLNNANNLLLAIKVCDGSFHGVNSEINELVKKKIVLIKKGMPEDVYKVLSPDEAVHGQRYILFKDKKDYYFLGDVSSVLKRLSA
jgi:hypothetical protein